MVNEMKRQLSMATRRELKQAVGERYRAAGSWERRQILDEFTRVTGYHRKHALRVLNTPGNRLETLKGGRKGQHSIRVNEQWRICLEWPHETPGPTNVEIVDYH